MQPETAALTQLVAVLARLTPFDEVVVTRDANRWIVAVEPDLVINGSGDQAFAALDAIARSEPGWWAGFMAYDLGRSIEKVRPRMPTTRAEELPDVRFARFPARLVIDGSTGRASVHGRGRRRRQLHRILERAARRSPGAIPYHLGEPRSSLARDDFETRVGTIVDLIKAGDCYQVNLTRQLTWEVPVNPDALLRDLIIGNPSPHAMMARFGTRAVVSASPERFLRKNGTRIETRPIKGTAAEGHWLLHSAKDRAENVMIVDLARNDLGRICEPGSIHVPELCALEAHPGLHHLVSTIRGHLRPEIALSDVIRATFPPASVTGAPKPRVMQAIEDLEPVRRGAYCGAMGWIDTSLNEMDLSVAIRTFTTNGERLALGVGAGIVVDSDPGSEWRETELKAAHLLAAAGCNAIPEVTTTGVAR